MHTFRSIWVQSSQLARYSGALYWTVPHGVWGSGAVVAPREGSEGPNGDGGGV